MVSVYLSWADLANKRNMGKISSLPVSITKLKSTFAQSEYTLKLDMGPTRFNPGPILLKQVMTAVTLVVKSSPSRERISVKMQINTI